MYAEESMDMNVYNIEQFTKIVHPNKLIFIGSNGYNVTRRVGTRENWTKLIVMVVGRECHNTYGFGWCHL